MARKAATVRAEPEAPAFYTAVAHFYSFHEGVPVAVAKHEVARAGHSIIEANPTMWVPLRVDWDTVTADAEDA